MARGGPGATAAKRATATIPIVMYDATDPVGIGLVESLARPGGNVTGLTDDQGAEIIGKRLQLLKEVAPTVSKVASLTRVPPSATVPRIAANFNAFDAGIKALGMQAQTCRLQGPDDIDKAFAEILKEGIGALYVNNLAARHRLPAICHHRTYAVDGGLMAYADDEREVPRRLAVYVDKILRGAKPADLPIQQPTTAALLCRNKSAAINRLGSLWQRLLGRPASESGTLRQGAAGGHPRGDRRGALVLPTLPAEEW